MYPVQVLREHVTALEAALSVCLAGPELKPVHKLRTETRRVEALLLLLDLLPSMPDHRKASAQLLRSLKKLRRAAGTVRDLDVHRKLLESLAEAENRPTDATAEDAARAVTSPGKEAPTVSAEGAQALVSAETDNAAVLSHSADELRKRLGRERIEAAKDLQDLLRKRQGKTARAAETLLEALEPVNDFALASPDLLRNADTLLTRDGLLGNTAVAKLNEHELHNVRKAAKKARYLAETLPDDPVLAGAAQRFEQLQEAGGQWHDALELAQAARHHFGKGHLLTALYRAEREGKLALYRSALSARVAAEASPKEPAAAPARIGSQPKVTRRVKPSAPQTSAA